MKLRMAVMGFVGLIGLIGPITPSGADVLDVRGRWVGFGQLTRSSPPGGPTPIPYPVTLDIVNQNHRRFTGRYTLSDHIVECEGTCPEPDRIHTVCTRLDFTLHVAGGSVRTVFAPAGEPILMAALQYLEVAPDREGDGVMILLQMRGGPDWNNPPKPVFALDGPWQGQYRSSVTHAEGNLMLNLAQILNQNGQPTTAVQGVGAWDAYPFPPEGNIRLRYRYVATGGDMIQLRATGPFGALGLVDSTPQGTQPPMICMLIGQVIRNDPDLPPGDSILGTYTLFSSLSDVYDHFKMELDTTFDHGTFSTNNPH